jgi:hypothetical protein
VSLEVLLVWADPNKFDTLLVNVGGAFFSPFWNNAGEPQSKPLFWCDPLESSSDVSGM